MAKKTTKAKQADDGKPELVDDPTVSEVFGDDFVGLLMHDGNIRITLATHRAIEHEPAEMVRVVSGRIVLSPTATIEMYQALSNLIAHLEEQGAVTRQVEPS